MTAATKKKTVLVAMSGGVDSSVAAGLLLRQGYSVEGVTLVFRPAGENDDTRWCGDIDSIKNAQAVCQTLDIPHHIINCFDAFEENVLRPSWETYRTGKTPSPCIVCNAKIKFQVILEHAKKLGATRLATGHYAVITHGDQPTLTRGEYTPKDQTYFLFALNKEQLNFTLFPLGGLTKPRVREMAREMGFINSERKESQDACFTTADGNFQEALRLRFHGKKEPGAIVDPHGNRLGQHDGLHNYTIGQRKGLNIALGKRAFVSRIDPVKNEVTLTTDEADLLSKTVTATGVRWTGEVVPDFPLRCAAQIRYRSKPSDGVATLLDNGRLQMVFDEPQKAVAPGQALVLYNGRQVLGGGWIEQGQPE
ncbi:MAG: tRNA 2-thiouridine(34) synthase MnmA [Deltaproteobacteria bacterium]|nr:tRNA 2-thiouridine(34) synthase MnmA [Deltaproteobacteria bacterium]MBN2671305.1 tRNA 2-thiouridine(34) synthase MnmA [Deltaproteobacteria bacterium]